jgi:hypothetical protein
VRTLLCDSHRRALEAATTMMVGGGLMGRSGDGTAVATGERRVVDGCIMKDNLVAIVWRRLASEVVEGRGGADVVDDGIFIDDGSTRAVGFRGRRWEGGGRRGVSMSNMLG